MAAPLERVDVPCPLCDSAERRHWGRENGYIAEKCQSCGLVYVTPRPTLEQISDGNKIGEHRTEAGSINVLYRRSDAKIRSYKSLVRRLFPDLLRDGRAISWLDVGAGYGEFVEALGSCLPSGSTVAGVEPMEAKAASARSRNLDVTSAPLSSISRKFDVVSLINVFSHIPNFDDFLTEIKSRLAPGGLLLLETGNGGDLQTADEYPDLLFLPDHLVFAGIGHVQAFLSRNNFEVVSITSARRDTLIWTTKNIVKKAIGRDVKLTLPYTSKFRTVFFKAKLLR